MPGRVLSAVARPGRPMAMPVSGAGKVEQGMNRWKREVAMIGSFLRCMFGGREATAPIPPGSAQRLEGILEVRSRHEVSCTER